MRGEHIRPTFFRYFYIVVLVAAHHTPTGKTECSAPWRARGRMSVPRAPSPRSCLYGSMSAPLSMVCQFTVPRLIRAGPIASSFEHQADTKLGHQFAKDRYSAVSTRTIMSPDETMAYQQTIYHQPSLRLFKARYGRFTRRCPRRINSAAITARRVV